MRALLAIVATVVVAACGGGVPATGGPGAPSAPGSAPTVDAAQRDALLAAGLPIDDATFLAATTYDVEELDATTARVVEQLASGDTIEFTVKLAAATSGEPGALTITSTTTDTEIDAFIRYVVDADQLPADVLEKLAAAPRQVAAIGSTAHELTAEVSLVEVTINWVMRKIESTVRDKGIQAVLQAVLPEKAGTIMRIIKAGFTVEKGVKLGTELDGQLEALDKLLECALNPTNPLTQQQYQQDPGAKDRLVEQITRTRQEMIVNEIVIQLGFLNGFVAGFGPKWLGYVIGPGTDWSQETLRAVNKELLQQADKAVTKCDCPFDVTGGGSSGGGSTGGSSGGSSSGGSGGGSAAQVCKIPQTWTGFVDYAIARDGKVFFTAHATNVTFKLRPTTDVSASTYDLDTASIAWTYDSVRHDGQCTITYKGKGTEPGVPNEEASGGGEGGGPFHAAEQASLVIHWMDPPMNRPTPFYIGRGHVRLHETIRFENTCSTSSDVDPETLEFNVGKWFETPSDAFPVIRESRMTGTWTSAPTEFYSQTWTWDLKAGD